MPPIWLLALVTKTGLTGRVAKGVSWLLIAAIAIAIGIAVVSLAQSLLRSHTAQTIENHDRDISLEVSNRIIAADRAAQSNADNAAMIERQNEKELDDAADGPSPIVGTLERMRQQQREGKR